MKSNKCVFILLFTGIFLLLLCIVEGRSLSVHNVISNGDIGTGKAAVTLRNTADAKNADGFTIGEISKLSELLKTSYVTYQTETVREKTTVEVDGSSYAARVTGTNYVLPRFTTMYFKHGCFFTESAEEEGDTVAVIDDEFAWKVFKDENVVGKTLKLYGKTFRITGVIKKDSSIINRMLEDGLAEIFIPGEKLLELDEAAKINTFQLKTTDAGTLDHNRILIANALSKAGKDPDDYTIIDFNVSQALLRQKTDLIVFAPGAVTILILLLYLKNIVWHVITIIRKECYSDYLSNVIKMNSRMVIAAGMKIMTTVLGIIMIASCISFKFYIPPSLIPEELIDISHYMNLINSRIQNEMSNRGYLESFSELYMRKINMLTGWPLFAAAAAGLLLVYLGLGKMKRLEMDTFQTTIACGFFFFLSLIILAAAAKIAELPFVLDTKNILVVWAFIYIHILYFLKRKESV